MVDGQAQMALTKSGERGKGKCRNFYWFSLVVEGLAIHSDNYYIFHTPPSCASAEISTSGKQQSTLKFIKKN